MAVKPAAKGGNPKKDMSKKRKNSSQQQESPAKKQRTAHKAAAAPKPEVKKLSSKERKQQLTEKKAKVKKNFSLIQDAVKKWELLRVKTTTPAEKEQLVHTIMSQMKGKLLQLANHHTASRIIQFCAKCGSPADRQFLFGEVKSNLLELSKSKYGHFLVRKLINTSKGDDLNGVMKLFKGHTAELLRHPYGADVVMDLYDVASTGQRNAMVAEFYGREFCLFDGVSGQSSQLRSLQHALEGAPAAKRRAMLGYFTKQLSPIVEKALLHPPVVHRLVRDFLEAAPASAVEDLVDTLSATGGGVLKMAHTHEGAQAACMVLAYGSPKDRKRVIKGMKGYVKNLALDEWGHTLLATALSVTDDTSLLLKVVVQELQADLEEILASKTGRRVLLQLLAPDNPRHCPPHILQMMHPQVRTAKGSGNTVSDVDGDEDGEGFGDDVDEGDEELLLPSGRHEADEDEDEEDGEGEGEPGSSGRQGDGGSSGEEGGERDGAKGSGQGQRVLGQSKKDPAVRRHELLGGAKGGLGAALCGKCAEEAGSMLREAGTCEVVVEVCRGGDGGVLDQVAAQKVAAVQEAVAREVAQSRDADDEQEQAEAGPSPQQEHVLVNYFASRALRRLVLLSGEEGPAAAVAQQAVRRLWDGALKGRCKQWVGSHAEKVLAALLSCGAADVREQARKELRGVVKGGLDSWAAQFAPAEGGDKAKQPPAAKGRGVRDQRQQKKKTL